MSDSASATKSKPRDPLADRRDKSGGLIDPPVIPEYEQRLQTAHAKADDLLIQDIMEEYHEAREKLAREDHDREQRRIKRRRQQQQQGEEE